VFCDASKTKTGPQNRGSRSSLRDDRVPHESIPRKEALQRRHSSKYLYEEDFSESERSLTLKQNPRNHTVVSDFSARESYLRQESSCKQSSLKGACKRSKDPDSLQRRRQQSMFDRRSILGADNSTGRTWSSERHLNQMSPWKPTPRTFHHFSALTGKHKSPRQNITPSPLKLFDKSTSSTYQDEDLSCRNHRLREISKSSLASKARVATGTAHLLVTTFQQLRKGRDLREEQVIVRSSLSMTHFLWLIFLTTTCFL
jgi:hypothetical protein